MSDRGVPFNLQTAMKPYVPNGGHAPQRKPKRARTAFTTDQIRILEEAFSCNKYIQRQERKDMAKSLNINDTCIKIWFQNRRMKEKRESSESSCNNSNESFANIDLSPLYRQPTHSPVDTPSGPVYNIDLSSLSGFENYAPDNTSSGSVNNVDLSPLYELQSHNSVINQSDQIVNNSDAIQHYGYQQPAPSCMYENVQERPVYYENTSQYYQNPNGGNFTKEQNRTNERSSDYYQYANELDSASEMPDNSYLFPM